MSDVKFISTESSKLDSIDIVNGQIIALKDKPGWYYDANGTRQHISSSAVGGSSLIGSTTINNTCLGVNACIRANGTNSVVIGQNASCTNSSIAIGQNVLGLSPNSVVIGFDASSTGYNSVVIGRPYDKYCSANSSIFVGYNIQHNGASSNQSVAIGCNINAYYNRSTVVGSMSRTMGQESVAIGFLCRSGSDAVSAGIHACANSYGAIAIGLSAHASTFCSIAIGQNTSVDKENSVALGNNAHCTNSNSIQLGDSTSLSSITSKVGITITSDERDKIDIKPIDYGALEFLDKIEPIVYKSNQRILYIDNENLSDEDKEYMNKYGICTYDKDSHSKGTKKGNRQRVGVKAQQVQEALESIYHSCSYANLVNNNLYDYDASEIPENIESLLSVNYSGFIPFLIKGLQELHQKVKELQQR